MLTRRLAAAVFVPVLVAPVFLGGSGSASDAAPLASTRATSTVNGVVRAGGEPVPGSRVGVYVTSPAGVSDRVAVVHTNGRGRFSASFVGPDQKGQVVYAIASGGAVRDRTSFRLMAVAGAKQSEPVTLTINELTTVAAAYSLAQFLHGTHLTGANPGLRNAAGTVASFVKPATGVVADEIAQRPNGSHTASLATFRTLADLVTGCTTGGHRACDTLLSTARARGHARPTNTLAAIHAIATDPTHHARRLFGLARPAFYTPQLAKAPTAWILTLKHTRGGFDGPGRMAFDSRGNIWVTNNFQPPGSHPGRLLIALGPNGHPRTVNPVRGGGLLGVWWGVAVDQQDRVWTSNYVGSDPTPFTSPDFTGGTEISEFTSKGEPLSPASGWTNGDFHGPQGITVDQQGNVWIANHTGNSVTEYLGGDPNDVKVYTDGISRPFAVEVDAEGNVWVDDNAIDGNDAGYATEIQTDGTVVQHAVPGLQSPQGMAFDSQGNLWIAGMLSNEVVELDSDGNVVKRYSMPSILGPWSIAVDGADHVWVASFWGKRLTELCGARVSTCPPGFKTGQPLAPRRRGFSNGGLQQLTAVQIDSAGNAWVANNWASVVPTTGGDGLVEYVGIAAPVRTPMIGPPQRP